MAYCKPCEQEFADGTRLRQHYRSKHPKLICLRCDRCFPSRTAKRQHVSASDRHHICGKCSHKPDFESREDLEDHYQTAHIYCSPCGKFFAKTGDLDKHDVNVHNMCKICYKHFKSLSNLKNHLKTHAEKNIECPVCPHLFASNSAMVLHLERGTCLPDNEEVDVIASRCYQSKHYTLEMGTVLDYACPTCATTFPSMGALLQHAESDACNEHLGRNRPLGKFLHFLRQQLRQQL